MVSDTEYLTESGNLDKKKVEHVLFKINQKTLGLIYIYYFVVPILKTDFSAKKSMPFRKKLISSTLNI
jgi:hypothetical protein